MRKARIVLVAAMVGLFAVGVVSAADGWQKIGSKTVVVNGKPKAVDLKTKDATVAAIKLKVGGEWVRFENLTLAFADGSSQVIDTPIDVAPGLTSDAIAIEGGPKPITGVTIAYKAASSARSGRATITILGES